MPKKLIKVKIVKTPFKAQKTPIPKTLKALPKPTSIPGSSSSYIILNSQIKKDPILRKIDIQRKQEEDQQYKDKGVEISYSLLFYRLYDLRPLEDRVSPIRPCIYTKEEQVQLFNNPYKAALQDATINRVKHLPPLRAIL